ncbi:MAG: hypothetical protein NT166_28105 [Candidatus Aminicenantes bacterium]|nr:hypothetical protein [Candidatus Aminicenantes bacterium]
MDILLIYKEQKYIIETKVNRDEDITVVEKEGIDQVFGKYLASEGVEAGYLVIFDTQTPVNAACNPQAHEIENKKITSFIIGIGRG